MIFLCKVNKYRNMKNKFIDVFPYEGDVELLRIRFVELQETVNLFIICDNSKNKDLDIIISNNFNSFKEKVIILKDFNYLENFELLITILHELDLDYEDIISLSKKNSIPTVNSEHGFRPYLFFSSQLCISPVYDYRDKLLTLPPEFGSYVTFYHDLRKKYLSDSEEFISDLKSSNMNTFRYKKLEGGKVFSDSKNTRPSIALFTFS
jgi:hypothetical protein